MRARDKKGVRRRTERNGEKSGKREREEWRREKAEAEVKLCQEGREKHGKSTVAKRGWRL